MSADKRLFIYKNEAGSEGKVCQALVIGRLCVAGLKCVSLAGDEPQGQGKYRAAEESGQ